MDDLEQKISDGMDIRKALKRVLAEHRTKFDSLFLYDEDTEEEMEHDNDEVID